MKSIWKSTLRLPIFCFLSATLVAQNPTSVIDLKRIADVLKFPRSELVITDYLDQEKFVYAKKTSSEEQHGRMPPVDPEAIFQSYQITSKTPNALLPIIVTLSKPNAYLTPEVKKIIEDYNAYAVTQRAQGGDFPYGYFELPGASHASIYAKTIRVPAHSKQIIEPGDTWTRLDEYPKFHPAVVSIVRDASSEVDVRIAQYLELYYPDRLVKVPGGEEYFAAFNDDSEDNPKESPISSIFKGLNQIVLTSPIMNSYRKTPVPAVSELEPPDSEEGRKSENLSLPQRISKATPQPTNAPDLLDTPKILALALLVLLLLASVLIKSRKK